jgi:precorrin-6B methylase 1
MEIRWERLTGFPRRPDLLKNVEFAALFVVEQLTEQEERIRADRATQVTMAALGVKAE